MTDAEVDRILRECAHSAHSDDDLELKALRAAILVEDAFHVVLSDEQINSDLLDDAAALRKLLTLTSRHP